MKLLDICLLILIFSQVQSEINNFNYDHHGADWASTWDQCSSPTQQSPVDLTSQTSNHNNSYLFLNFNPQKAIIYWYNTTVYVRTNPLTLSFGEAYTRTAKGSIPSLRANEVRIRTHSEHRIDGKYFDLELQVFCVGLYNSFRVEKLALGLMFEVGAQGDPFLQGLIDSYVPGNQTVPFPSVNTTLSLAHLLNNNDIFDFWLYQGSLTIPPCFTGKTSWVVSRQVYSMSQKQRDFFWNMFNGEGKSGNWRQIQPIADDELALYQWGK